MKFYIANKEYYTVRSDLILVGNRATCAATCDCDYNIALYFLYYRQSISLPLALLYFYHIYIHT